MKVALTGSTGSFGTLVIKHLENMHSKDFSIVALARNMEKAEGLKSRGVEVRLADYNKAETLAPALEGVDRLLLVSGSEFGVRVQQHKNVIEAAQKAGVKFLVYTSITNASDSGNPLAAEHKATEEIIRSSGIDFVILRNNWYTENYAETLKRAKDSGIIMAAAGTGRVASVSRTDLAEAAAKVLAGQVKNIEKDTYELSGESWDYNQLAAVMANVIGKQVIYKPVTSVELRSAMMQTGMPEHIAGFLVSLDEGIAAGTLDFESSDLELLLGRKPATLRKGLANMLKQV